MVSETKSTKFRPISTKLHLKIDTRIKVMFLAGQIPWRGW